MGHLLCTEVYFTGPRGNVLGCSPPRGKEAPEATLSPALNPFIGPPQREGLGEPEGACGTSEQGDAELTVSQMEGTGDIC